MHFSKIATIVVSALAAGAFAAPGVARPNTRPEYEEILPGQELTPDDSPSVVKRGFGCPGDEYSCDDHCSSKGFTGGYCGGPWWLDHPTCTCYN